MPATSNLLFTSTPLANKKANLEQYFHKFVKIILPRTKSGKFVPDDYAADSAIQRLFGTAKYTAAASKAHELAFDVALFHQKTITPKDVYNAPAKYLIFTSQYDLMDLCDFFPDIPILSKEQKKTEKDPNDKADFKGIFIWSQYLADTGSEEGDYFYHTLTARLERCKLDLVQIHTSGHTDPKALFKMINKIGQDVHNFTVKMSTIDTSRLFWRSMVSYSPLRSQTIFSTNSQVSEI